MGFSEILSKLINTRDYFFQNLFGKSEPFVPAPTQVVPGLDPIVVQAVENVFTNREDQKEVFDYSLRFRQRFHDHLVR